MSESKDIEETFDFSYEFEREFLAEAVACAKKLGMSKKEFSERAFPAEANPDRKLQALLKPQSKTGRPQSLLLSEAFRIAEVIGEDLPGMSFRVKAQLQHQAVTGRQPVKKPH